MKIAIPEWQGRVSPVLDASQHLKIFEIEAECATPVEDIACNDETLSRRVLRLSQTGAKILICGAVSNPLQAAITAAGIEVIPQTCGNVGDVAEAYAKGLLTVETFLMPGCGHRNRRCRRQAGRHQQHATRRRQIKCQQEMEQGQWEQDQ